MKHKHTHYIYASFAFLLFVALGYMVKFYPEALTGFDSNIQTWVRGDLPGGLTAFFKMITTLGNTSVQAVIAILAVIWLYLRQYKAEAIFVGTSGVLASIMIMSLKYIYQRPRPSITHLVHAGGYSFPSGHSLGTFMILGAIAIVLTQRLVKKAAKTAVYGITGLLIFLVGLSRIYVGVHYPTDVMAGICLGISIVSTVYVLYYSNSSEEVK